MIEPLPDTENDVNDEDRHNKQSLRSSIDCGKVLVSQSTHEQEQNDDHNANSTEKEGNSSPPASTPRVESINQTTTQMPPLVMNVSPSSPQRRDLDRISGLEDSFDLGHDSDGLL